MSELQNIRFYPTPKFIDSNSNYRVIPTRDLLKVVDLAIAAQIKFSPEVSRIFTCGQMGGYVIKNNQGFEIVSWQDHRSLLPAYADRRNEFDTWLRASVAFKETGSEIRPGLPLYALSLMSEVEGFQISQQSFRSVISFVTSYLTDYRCDCMHITDASSSGFFNLTKNKWDPELVSKVDSNLKFQNVLFEVEKIGYSTKFGLDVYCGVGDQQASLLGAGLDPGNVVINIGTGGQIAGLHSDSEEMGGYQVRPYFGGQKIRTITHLPSGRALKAFVQFCVSPEQSDEDYETFIKMGSDLSRYELIDLSNYEDTIKSIANSEYANSYIYIASSFFNSLIETYVKSLSDLKLSGDLVFAGGIGQKIALISKEISTRTNREFFISNTKETSLAGLGKIAGSF